MIDRCATKPDARAWATLATLCALMIANYVDRQVVVAMFPELKREWQLSDTELAGLVSIVSLVVALALVPLSTLAARWSPLRAIGTMAVAWSAATIACAFAPGYASLMALRAIIGLAEAAFGAVAASALATWFPQRMRSTIMGTFLACALVGMVAGVVLGGVVGERFGWRAAFIAAGLPGLAFVVVLALIARRPLFVTRPPDRTEGRVPLANVRTVLLLALASGVQLAPAAAVYAWMPTFLHRAYELAPEPAAALSGALMLASALGVTMSGAIADRLGARLACARVVVCVAVSASTSMLLGAGFGLIDLGAAQLVAIALGMVVMAGVTGPVAAAVADVVAPASSGRALALLALTQNLVGFALGPSLAALLSDRIGIAPALALTSLLGLPAAALFASAITRYDRDRASTSAAATLRSTAA